MRYNTNPDPRRVKAVAERKGTEGTWSCVTGWELRDPDPNPLLRYSTNPDPWEVKGFTERKGTEGTWPSVTG